jgi:hypothetical protein
MPALQVIFDPTQVVACHDYEYMWAWTPLSWLAWLYIPSPKPPCMSQFPAAAAARELVCLPPRSTVMSATTNSPCSCSDLWPDPERKSCFAAFNHSSKLPSFVSRDGAWHHLAVTWEAQKDGLTQVRVSCSCWFAQLARKCVHEPWPYSVGAFAPAHGRWYGMHAELSRPSSDAAVPVEHCQSHRCMFLSLLTPAFPT